MFYNVESTYLFHQRITTVSCASFTHFICTYVPTSVSCSFVKLFKLVHIFPTSENQRMSAYRPIFHFTSWLLYFEAFKKLLENNWSFVEPPTFQAAYPLTTVAGFVVALNFLAASSNRKTQLLAWETDTSSAVITAHRISSIWSYQTVRC